MPIPKEILAATDFSPLAEHAVDYAFALARAWGGRVHLLHAYATPDVPHGAALATRVIDDYEQEVHARFEAAAKRRSSPELGKTVVRMGAPREQIVRAAHELKADLVVVGTRGRGRVSRWMMGSVAESMVRSAPCPVLVVRGDQKADF